MRAPTINPVLRRELLERWRGRRSFLVFTVYVALLGGALRFLYWGGTQQALNQQRWGWGQPITGPEMGRFLFENLIAFVLVLVLFITPGYAAAQIAGERERKTLGLLQLTLVRPYQIVAGKLGASVAWVLLLVVSSLPFAGMAFFLGGVSLADLLRATFTTVVLAVSVAGIGIGVSSLMRRTTGAVVTTYALILVLTVGTLVTATAEFALREMRGRNANFQPGEWVPVSLYFNPFFGLADAARVDQFRFDGSGLGSVLTPFGFVLPNERVAFERGVAEPAFIEQGMDGPAPAFIEREAQDQDAMLVDPAFAPLPAPLPGRPDVVRERSPVWLLVLAVYLALGAAGFSVASRRVQPERGPLRRRAGRRERRRMAAAEVERESLATVLTASVPLDEPPPPPPPDAAQ